ncbi:unnamed protein product, partial [Urochloa humidicola]
NQIEEPINYRKTCRLYTDRPEPPAGGPRVAVPSSVLQPPQLDLPIKRVWILTPCHLPPVMSDIIPTQDQH